MNTMYLFKARVKITSDQPNESYKPLSVKGLFIPKTKTKKHAYVEEKCTEYLISNLQKDHPELSFKVTNVKIESFKPGFTINENQQ